MHLRSLTPVFTAFLVALLSVAVLAVLTACSWSVPADPGENARLRSDPRPGPADASAALPSGSASDEGARLLYMERCGRCHEPFAPGHASAAEWPSIVRHYGPRAGLFGGERERVIAWLQAHAP